MVDSFELCQNLCNLGGRYRLHLFLLKSSGYNLSKRTGQRSGSKSCICLCYCQF